MTHVSVVLAASSAGAYAVGWTACHILASIPPSCAASGVIAIIASLLATAALAVAVAAEVLIRRAAAADGGRRPTDVYVSVSSLAAAATTSAATLVMVWAWVGLLGFGCTNVPDDRLGAYGGTLRALGTAASVAALTGGITAATYADVEARAVAANRVAKL